MSRTSNIRLQFYQTFIFFLFRSAFKMEYIQSTRLEVVNGVQTENFQSKSSNEEGQSPDSIEKPIDYSLSRKRRILDNFNEESPLNKTKKTRQKSKRKTSTTEHQGQKKTCGWQESLLHPQKQEFA